MLRLFNENSLETYSKYHNYNVPNMSKGIILLHFIIRNMWEINLGNDLFLSYSYLFFK